MHELAQINVVLFAEPIGSARLNSFVAQVARINTVAETSAGFLWRYREDSGGAVEAISFPDGSTLGALSVWRDIESLRQFVYGAEHISIIRRRGEWMLPLGKASMALWWIPGGERPSLSEGWRRLECLRRHGPTCESFTFSCPYDLCGSHLGK